MQATTEATGLRKHFGPATAQDGAAVALASRREDRLNVSDARCEALFASWLQPSHASAAETVAEAINCTLRQFGIGGCVSRMAQEFGDHPEAAAERMRWALRAVAGARPRGQAANLPPGSIAIGTAERREAADERDV
jgi:hypothetical protein